VTVGSGSGCRVRWGSKGPVPGTRRREWSARMEPSRTGAADARRVVLSTPTAPVDLTHCRSREPGLTDTHVV